MNWKAVIADIVASGVKQSDIAAKAQCAPSTISEIANGVTKNPGWQIASVLQDLHRKALRRKPKNKAAA